MTTSGINASVPTARAAHEVAAPVAPQNRPFTAAAMKNASAAEQRKAVAQQFEAILVRQLLGKPLTSMLGGESGGVSGSVYGDMLADTISQQLTAGPGLGLGRFLEQQLGPRTATPTSQPVGTTSEQATDTTATDSGPVNPHVS